MKKLLTGVLGTGAIIASLPMIAAFEAHVVNVTATIENAMFAPVTEIMFGTVFPQEALEDTFDIRLSDSYQEAFNATTGVQWASVVVDASQGVRKNGTAVLPDRSDPNDALGPAESAGTPYDNPVVAGSFFSLGFSPTGAPEGGWIILGFDNFIVNEAGPDIRVFEVTGGSNYPDERINVEASKDGVAWTLLASGVTRDVDVDLGPLDWAKFVRITDVSNPALFESTADAYDLDAVRATSREVLGGNVEYVVRQKPKCIDEAGNHPQVGEDEEGNFVCPEGSEMMPLLCPYLSKHEQTGDPDEAENDGPGITAFHGLPGPWTLDTSILTQVIGHLSMPVSDIEDRWLVDLKVPCFEGQCAQDWPDFVREHSGDPEIDVDAYKADPELEHEFFGCDLWVEVVELS